MSDYNLEYQRKYSTSIREQEEKEQNIRSIRLEESRRQETIKKQYQLFCEGAVEYFLTEGISYFALEAIKLNESAFDIDFVYNNCKSTIKRYIKENNYHDILRHMQEKTQLLSEMSLIIENHIDIAKESVDKSNPDTFYIRESNSREFYKDLSKLNADKVSEKINKRVVDATDDFVQNNINDKLDMEDTAKQIKEKSDKYKSSDEEVQKEFTTLYKKTILEKRNNRPKNILEQIINENARHIIRDDELRSSFTESTGKVSFDAIKEFSIGVYYGLETLNTMRINEMNASMVKELLESIKS